ncbi:MAG: hypothetical protein P4M07_08370 [Xanthobacteraceae bacterium]|nr:hypothetical protein [Xanthobacteraceae bacterium]
MAIMALGGILHSRPLRILGFAAALSPAIPIGTPHAQELRRLDQRFLLGVGTHQGMGGPESRRGYVPAISIEQIKALGVTAFRDDFSWSDFELPDRRRTFTPLLGRLETQIKADVAIPLLILGSGHPKVANSSPPTTDEARQRFVDYAVAAATAVVGRHPLFELWNEWNIAARQNPAFNVENYVALAKAVRPAVKRAAPGAPFLVGAIGDDPGWRWTDSLLRAGLLADADGISVHLYNHCAAPARRTAAELIERLTAFHALVDRASGAPDYPVYVTEAGWPTVTGKCAVSAQAEADNMAQLVLWAATASPWLKGLWLYELKDSGTDPRELEDNFGLYDFGNAPKPAVCAVRDAWAFVRDGITAEKRALAPDVVLIRSTNAAGARKAAIWAEDPGRRYQVRLKGEAPGVTFGHPCGQASRPAPGEWTALSATPLLVTTDGAVGPDFELRIAE